MRVLVACEESQTVTKEFRNLGYEAYSCDIIPCSGGHPEWHYQQDVTELLQLEWDLIIAHPPCTYLTISNNRAMVNGCKTYTAEEGKLLRQDAIIVSKGEFFEWVDVKTGKVKRQAAWDMEALKLPRAERAKVRSKTFQGIAEAMALQWGGFNGH
jgi:hypothetical protein